LYTRRNAAHGDTVACARKERPKVSPNPQGRAISAFAPHSCQKGRFLSRPGSRGQREQNNFDFFHSQIFLPAPTSALAAQANRARACVAGVCPRRRRSDFKVKLP